MIYPNVILIRIIFITSTILLFSYNAYGVYNKNRELTLKHSNIDYNKSHDASSSTKYNTENRKCVYNEANKFIISVLIRSANTVRLHKLRSYVIRAINHPVNCILAHDIANIARFFDAADSCKDHNAIDLLTGQLARGDVAIADGIWQCESICSILCSLSSHTDSNANIVREMVASNIVNLSTNLRTWKPTAGLI